MKEIGIAGKLAGAFIQSKLTPLIIAASILLGIGAVIMLPREEEPQIIVPMIDVMVQMPGASSKEVEERVTKPMEKLLWKFRELNTSIPRLQTVFRWRSFVSKSVKMRKTRLSASIKNSLQIWI